MRSKDGESRVESSLLSEIEARAVPAINERSDRRGKGTIQRQASEQLQRGLMTIYGDING